MINDGETAHVFGGAEWLFSVPNGVRVTTDRQGQIRSLTGMSATTMTGTLETPAASVPLSLSPNEVLALTATGLKRARPSRLTLPTF